MSQKIFTTFGNGNQNFLKENLFFEGDFDFFKEKMPKIFQSSLRSHEFFYSKKLFRIAQTFSHGTLFRITHPPIMRNRPPP